MDTTLNDLADPNDGGDQQPHRDGDSAARGEAERVRSLRSAIDEKLREHGVYEQIRALVRSKAETRDAENTDPVEADGVRPASLEAKVIDEVLESDLVQRVIESVRIMSVQAGPREPSSRANADADDDVYYSGTLASDDVQLYLRLAGGKAFVDQLVEQDGLDPDAVVSMNQVGQVMSFFRVVVTFQRQRQTSADVVCAVDPKFDEHFRFHIDRKEVRKARTRTGTAYDIEISSPWEALCLVDEPVQLHLLKVVKRLQQWRSSTDMQWRELSTELVAVHSLDWRRVLCSGLQMVHFPVQLVGAMKVPVGLLDIRADVFHFKRTAAVAHSTSSFLNKETLERNARNHAFFKLAKQWWDEYRSETRYLAREDGPDGGLDGSGDRYTQLLAQANARPRLIKLFAEDSEGRYRMVCRYLVPLRAPLSVRTPGEAARFVSLLPYEARMVVGGIRDEAWRSIAAFLATRKGDDLDHSILLASLLLGWGLDAFVCIGTVSAAKSKAQDRRARSRQSSHSTVGSTAAEIGHVWVMTRGENLETPSAMKVVFWEAVSGEKRVISPNGTRGSSGYCSIDCVFNDRELFANLQPRAWSLLETSFKFEDETMWKTMAADAIADLPFGQPPVYMSPPLVGAAARREQEWTDRLRREVTSRRRTNGLATRWSDELSFYLLPALNAYELERVYDVTQVENDFFQQSVARYVPDGYTFQGVPLLFTWEQLDDCVDALESYELVSQLLTLHARAASFGIAVRAFAYAEGMFATWVMLAASYQTTAS